MKDVVEMGDKVIKINGKPAGKYDFCESMLNGIPELKAKKKYFVKVRAYKTVGKSKVYGAYSAVRSCKVK